jgi:hypothetical protein
MSELAVKEVSPSPIARDKICSFEKLMATHPKAMFGDCFPLKHTFADGLYVREITCPAGALIATKIFKQTHATFLLKGEVSVATERGVERIKAPYSLITKSGTKRIIFCHSDVIWTTVHANKDDERDIDKIENFVIAESFDEIPNTPEENLIIDMAETSKITEEV